MDRKFLVPLAYGYVRFSSAAQESGDSVRRQRDGILAWLKRHKTDAQLDTSLGDSGFYVDEGMTGFAVTGSKRASLEGYALGEFIRDCESQRIQPGSVLIVESADRLSRESPVVALNLLTNLLMLGVTVVTLVPEMEYKSDSDIGKVITVGVTIDRAHDESRVKNTRSKNAWKAKQANAARHPLTTMTPAWCRLVGAERGTNNRLIGGKICEDASRTELVRRMFSMAEAGMGTRAIAKTLNAEKVPVLGRSELWTDHKVYKILTSRKVLGEYRPHTGRTGSKRKGRADTRKPTGEVVQGYYPAIISPVQFANVQDALKTRSTIRGRRGKHLNLFTGLLRDPRDGGRIGYRHISGRPSALISINAQAAAVAAWSSFPATTFENAVLSKLRELKAAEVVPDSDSDGKVRRLSRLHTEKGNELQEFQKQIDEEPRLLKTLKGTLLRLETEYEQLARDLGNAQREAASPLSEAWGSFKGIAELLAKHGSEELRMRCQVALRRLIESVHCVFTGPKMTRLAAVRVQFKSGIHRDYLIVAHCKNKNRKNPPLPWVGSPPEAWADKLGELDLRLPKHARAIEKLLLALNPNTLAGLTHTNTEGTEP